MDSTECCGFAYIFLFSPLEQEAGPAVFEPYQGLLYPTEEYRVYGYITCTRVKLLIVVDDSVRAVTFLHYPPR